MQNFKIAEEKSEIRVLVYKAGALSAIAHNHVMTIEEIKGEIIVDTENFDKSSFKARIPVYVLYRRRSKAS